MAFDAVWPHARDSWQVLLADGLRIASVLIFCLHYLHLGADLPHTTWLDWTRYQHEGWYAGAGIRKLLTGHWRYPGDFNPGVALPVFPTLAYRIFRVFGFGVDALRAMNVTIFGLSLIVCGLLVNRYSTRLAGAGVVFLLACSPFFFAFSRLGIAEPLLILELLLALLLASFVRFGSLRSHYLPVCVGVGLVLASMALTKTTGLALAPAVLYLVWSRCDSTYRSRLGPLTVVILTGLGSWGLCYIAMLKNGGGDDFHHFFVINQGYLYGRMLLPRVWIVMKDGLSIGPALYVTSIAAVLVNFAARRERPQPLLVATLIAATGYGALIAFHGWIGPRYYLVATLLCSMALVLSTVELARSERRPLRVFAVILAAVSALSCVDQIRTQLLWSRYPSYSYSEAAQKLSSIVAHDASGNRVVLGRATEEMALLTGVPLTAVTDRFGLLPLRKAVSLFRPGWLLTLDRVQPVTQTVLSDRYSLQLVGSQPVYGDGCGFHRLLLYRLVPTQ